jgi:hypothetical protein
MIEIGVEFCFIFHNKVKPILDIFLFFSFNPMMDHDLLTEPKNTKKNN